MRFLVVMIPYLLLGLLAISCFDQLLGETYGGIPINMQPATTQLGTWDSLKRYSMHYNNTTSISANDLETSLSNVDVDGDNVSSRMTFGMIGFFKFIILMIRLVGDYLRKFGSELRVAKCLLMYSFTFQPLSSKVNSDSILNLLTSYFGDQDARDVYRFLKRNVFVHLGLELDS